jgi:hypothetical protein
MIVYHKVGCALILFSKKTIFLNDNGNIYTFKNYLNNPDIWYIVNSQKAKEYRTKTILIYSFRKDYYRNFDKYSLIMKQFMPV